jgi:hypothetical protein
MNNRNAIILAATAIVCAAVIAATVIATKATNRPPHYPNPCIAATEGKQGASAQCNAAIAKAHNEAKDHEAAEEEKIAQNPVYRTAKGSLQREEEKLEAERRKHAESPEAEKELKEEEQGLQHVGGE